VPHPTRRYSSQSLPYNKCQYIYCHCTAPHPTRRYYSQSLPYSKCHSVTLSHTNVLEVNRGNRNCDLYIFSVCCFSCFSALAPLSSVPSHMTVCSYCQLPFLHDVAQCSEHQHNGLDAGIQQCWL
jgi:hypothetical protein